MPSYGYDKQAIRETAIPHWSRGQGHPAHIKDPAHFAVLSVNGFTMTVAGGDAWGYGIADVGLGPTTLTFSNPGANATRYDTVVIRRDFRPAGGSGTPGGVTTVDKNEGGSGRQLTGGFYDVGVLMDAALFLVQIGPSGIVAWEDVRTFSGSHLVNATAGMTPGDAGAGARGIINGADMVRVPNASGQLDWQSVRPSYQRIVPVTESMVRVFGVKAPAQSSLAASLGTYTFQSPYKAAPFRIDCVGTIFGYIEDATVVLYPGRRGTSGYVSGRATLSGTSSYEQINTPTEVIISRDGAAVTLRPEVTCMRGKFTLIPDSASPSQLIYTVTTL